MWDSPRSLGKGSGFICSFSSASPRGSLLFALVVSAAAPICFCPRPPLSPGPEFAFLDLFFQARRFFPTEPTAGEQGRQHKGETRSPCPEPDPPAGLLGGTQREGQRQEKNSCSPWGVGKSLLTQAWQSPPRPTPRSCCRKRSFLGINCSDPVSRGAAELKPDPNPECLGAGAASCDLSGNRQHMTGVRALAGGGRGRGSRNLGALPERQR